MRGWSRAEPRGLTTGERRAVESIFGHALDLGRVRIHARPFFWLQPARTAMSPNGQVYFHQADHRPDFSASWRGMAWLIHELTHVWQYRTGQWVIPRALWERRYHYGALDRGRTLRRHGIEQQAAIVEDWFRITQGQSPWRGTGTDSDYRAVIPFLPDGAGAFATWAR